MTGQPDRSYRVLGARAGARGDRDELSSLIPSVTVASRAARAPLTVAGLEHPAGRGDLLDERVSRPDRRAPGVVQLLEALASPAPGWLDDLVSVLHARRATVVSFDCDHVLECAVDGHHLIDHRPHVGAQRQVTSDDVLDRLPAMPPPTPDEIQAMIDVASYSTDRYVPTWPRQGVADTFRLLKLHGSLSWYWSPDDVTGSTLQRWRVPGIFGQPAADDDDAAAECGRRLPGRVLFVVSPTAAKTSYLSNLVVRELWGRARDALAAADRVVIVGYSVPAEDQLASGLFADSLRGREVDVVIADICPDAVAERLSSLGVQGADAATTFDTKACVGCLVEWWRDRQARFVVEQLRILARTRTAGPVVELQAR